MSGTADQARPAFVIEGSADADDAVDAAVDNDILIKAAVVDLADELVVPRAGVLGQARFVAGGRVRRMELQGDRATAVARAESLIARCRVLEPVAAEVALAAQIEREAALADLALDGGESLLAAIVVSRGVPELHTGDKRAIAALERLLAVMPPMSAIRGRVRSLEQLALTAASRLGAPTVGAAVCAEPAADKTLTICSECHSSRALNVEALESYVARLRATAPSVLAV